MLFKCFAFGSLLMLTFYFGWNFMMGLGKPRLCTKFKFASFSHRINIEEHPKFWELFESTNMNVIFPWVLANRSCMPNLKSLALPVTKI